MRYDRPELRERLAGEYALGTLHGAARRRFERLLRADGGLRDLVAEWQDRFAPLAGGLAAVDPSPALLGRIEQQLGITGAAAAGAEAAATVPGSARPAATEATRPAGHPAAAAPAPRPPPRRPVVDSGPSFWERWFGVRQLGLMAAGVFLGVAVSQLVPVLRTLVSPPPAQTAQLPQSYVGILADPGGVARMLVSSLRHGKLVDIKVLQPVSAPAGSTLFLWAIPRSGAPFVIGKVPSTGKATLEMTGTSEQLLSAVGELAVSAEPSATPPPTPSPFLLRGPCAKLW